MASLKHYKVQAYLRADAPVVTPISDYPWWSALWDIVLTMAGAWSIEVLRVFARTLLSL